MGLFPFRVEWVFFASKRNAQAVTTLMGDTKVELGDDVATSYGKATMRQIEAYRLWHARCPFRHTGTPQLRWMDAWRETEREGGRG